MSDVRIDAARNAANDICTSLAFGRVDWGEVIDRCEVLHRIASDADRLGDEPVMWICGIHNGATIDIAGPAPRASREEPDA